MSCLFFFHRRRTDAPAQTHRLTKRFTVMLVSDRDGTCARERATEQSRESEMRYGGAWIFYLQSPCRCSQRINSLMLVVAAAVFFPLIRYLLTYTCASCAEQRHLVDWTIVLLLLLFWFAETATATAIVLKLVNLCFPYDILLTVFTFFLSIQRVPSLSLRLPHLKHQGLTNAHTMKSLCTQTWNLRWLMRTVHHFIWKWFESNAHTHT